jgi:hypothetical protein
LTPADRRRYARQLLLREIGESGQVRLLSARARLLNEADPRAAAVAADYLERAGLALEVESSPNAIVVDVGSPAAITRLSGRPELEPAASALCGAFAAVEAVKVTLGVGAPARLPAGLQLAARSG